MSGAEGLKTHLETGDTRVCRCWLVVRRDGTRFGFTDHDEDLVFDGQRFRADTGMTPGAVQKSTGLSVDNVEVVGALADTSLTEADIEAGRMDGAVVEHGIHIRDSLVFPGVHVRSEVDLANVILTDETEIYCDDHAR